MTQDDMPQGLAPGALLDANEWYRDYELVDERTGGVKVKRVVRIINGSTHQPWYADFRQRLESLLPLTLPYVATVRETGIRADGKPYLIRDVVGTRLRDNVQNTKGIAAEDAQRWLRQLLTGLAALHARGLPHGDLGLHSVLIDRDIHPPTAWIADAAVGPMASWSDGEFLHAAASRYVPPEWKGRLRKPTPKADLYALGLLMCEALLGTAALDELKRGEDAPSVWRQLGPAIRRTGVSGAVGQLLEALLRPEPDRPADAVEALNLFQRLERRQSRRRLGWGVAAGLAVCLLLLAGLTVLWWRTAGQLAGTMEQLEAARVEAINLKEANSQRYAQWEEQRTKLEKEITVLKDELRSIRIQSNTELEAEKAKYGKLEEEHTQLKEALAATKTLENLAALQGKWPPDGEPPPPSPEEIERIAQRIFSESLRSDGAFVEELNDLLNAFKDQEELKKRVEVFLPEPPDDVVKAVSDQGRRWRGQCLELFKEARPWLLGEGKDEEMHRRYRAARGKPWDAGEHASAREHLASIGEGQKAEKAAEERWRGWAYDETKSWDDVNRLIDSGVARGEEEFKILSQWRDALVVRRGAGWQLKPIKGAGPGGWGVTRQIAVQGTSWIYSDVHNWDDPTNHDYNAGATRLDPISFSWEPGTPTGIYLYGERTIWKSGVRYTLIAKPDHFKGPLAIWRMHDAGQVEQNGFKLEFEIDKCPGPPRRKPVISTILP